MHTRFHSIKEAAVALDMSPMDDHLIRYAELITRFLPIERLFFVHVAKDLELPSSLLKKYPNLMAPVDEGIEEDIRKKIARHFKQEKGPKIVVAVKEGLPVDKLLRFVAIKNVDLIIMGRKRNLAGSGIVSSHITRKAPCSMLLVPEGKFTGIRHILVPTDFSTHSGLAFQQAQHLAEKAKSRLSLVHIYGVPKGFYKTGKTHAEFAEIMESHARKECQKFLGAQHVPGEISCKYLLTDNGHHAQLIHGFAEEEKTDLIVMGSKGRTNASSVLLGCMAEKLTFQDHDIPLLIIKNKGENMGFLEALMRV